MYCDQMMTEKDAKPYCDHRHLQTAMSAIHPNHLHLGHNDPTYARKSLPSTRTKLQREKIQHCAKWGGKTSALF